MVVLLALLSLSPSLAELTGRKASHTMPAFGAAIDLPQFQPTPDSSRAVYQAGQQADEV